MVLGQTSSYFLHNVRYNPMDSVNLVFEGFDDVHVILQALMASRTGWTTWSIQAHEYLEDGGTPPYLRKESTFAVKSRAVATTLGPIGLQHLWRFHLRLWECQNRIVSCAHEEGPTLLRLPPWLPLPIHNVISFDSGRQEVISAFGNVSQYRIVPRALEVGTRIQDPPCDGWATLIQKVS